MSVMFIELNVGLMEGFTACGGSRVSLFGTPGIYRLANTFVRAGFKLGKEAAFSVLDKWRRIRHPNIVSVREAFTTRLFNDACKPQVP